MKIRSLPRSWPRPVPFLSALAALGLGACAGRQQTSAPPYVAVVKAVRRNLANTMVLQAEFEPYQDILVHGKVSGYVSDIRVDIGDKVKAGDLIATIEVPELQEQLAAAIAAAQRARADHEIAHLDSERLQKVSRSQPSLVAQQDLDDAAAKDEATAAAYASARAEAARYRALMDYTRITAPFDGVITKRFVDLGSLIQAGTASNPQPLVELAQYDLLRLRFPVPEAETPLVRDGERIQVSVDALDRTFSGRIVRDTWAIDRSTRTMLTEVDVPNPSGALQAGMYASVALPLASARGVLTVPLLALSPGSPPTVMRVGPDGTVEERAVSVGLRTANWAEIRSGLRAGDRVIVSDRSELNPGDKVSPREEDYLASGRAP